MYDITCQYNLNICRNATTLPNCLFVTRRLILIGHNILRWNLMVYLELSLSKVESISLRKKAIPRDTFVGAYNSWGQRFQMWTRGAKAWHLVDSSKYINLNCFLVVAPHLVSLIYVMLHNSEGSHMGLYAK